MDETGITFIVAMLITTIIGILGFNWRRRGRKMQAARLDADWILFENAVDKKNYELMKTVGLELAYNVHLKKKQLETMSATVDSLIDRHPSFEKLRLAILNKKLHYERQPGW
ncbi:hypothetical protein DNU06_11700 [Putridiphycobacter roseus]|uniref:Uncharacterized protein n=1 Tax=Putridiphycobacter roseus TaxID=2219161 RepID=A0A2W1NEM5_9FLAO|nr:hypothetical protein [Putridiphycobacter roseus]PZE16516.1 hypothetical protein DNU06_11700 [Putridiphycobacter roseus]